MSFSSGTFSSILLPLTVLPLGGGGGGGGGILPILGVRSWVLWFVLFILLTGGGGGGGFTFPDPPLGVDGRSNSTVERTDGRRESGGEGTSRFLSDVAGEAGGEACGGELGVLIIGETERIGGEVAGDVSVGAGGGGGGGTDSRIDAFLPNGGDTLRGLGGGGFRLPSTSSSLLRGVSPPLDSNMGSNIDNLDPLLSEVDDPSFVVAAGGVSA